MGVVGYAVMGGERTEAMNMPKMPPMPNPMTPDMTDLPRHDSIAAWTYISSLH
jgi:hypothetical protein